MEKMLRPFLVLALLLPAAAPVLGQGTYSQTLPTIQGSPLSSWVSFSFPNTPPTTGPGSFAFQWRACWQEAFGGSSKIWIEVMTGPGSYTQVYYETGNTAECVALARTAPISAPVLASALAAGGGALSGRVKVQDSCYPGVGCSFYNDPQVLGFTLSYAMHAANFSAAEPAVCPGATVAFTDASLNTPSSYQWYFPGGTPSSSTAQNPTVQYAVPGSYDVKLVVTTADGPDSLLRADFVTVHAPPAANAGVDEDLCAGESAQLQASGGVSYQWFPAEGLDNANIAAPMAAPENSTSYTVLVTDGHGCTASDNMVLTVHPLPTVAASAGNNAVCLGDTAHVVAAGAQLYQWAPNLFISSTSGAAVQVWPTSTFTWTLTGTDAHGCVNDSTFTLAVHTLPPAPVVTNDGMQLASTAASAYQWYLNGAAIAGADQQQWAPVVNGNYTVEITDANGCTAMALPVYFGTAGVQEAGTPPLRIYPQPVLEQLVVEGLAARARARIIDARGAVAWEGALPAGNSTVGLAALAPGSYTLELRTADGVQRLPVIKE